MSNALADVPVLTISTNGTIAAFDGIPLVSGPEP
jgi:hypothetical protein